MTEVAIPYQVERLVASVQETPADETPPSPEEKDPAPSSATVVDATPAAGRPATTEPVVARAAREFPAPACTAAHRTAAPRNRFEQRAAKSQARKAVRQADKRR
jgi:hypothetical protein